MASKCVDVAKDQSIGSELVRKVWHASEPPVSICGCPPVYTVREMAIAMRVPRLQVDRTTGARRSSSVQVIWCSIRGE